MIRINLLALKEVQRALDRRRQVSIALLSLAVAALVMVVPYVLQGIEMSRLEREIDALNAEVAKLNQQAREVRDLERKRADLRAKLKVIADLQNRRVGPVRVLEDLSGATPEKLWLVDFTDSAGQATITGMALDNQTIATFMRQLQASKYYYDVDLVEATESVPSRGSPESQGGVVFKKFVVKARLDYTGADGVPPPGSEVTGKGAAAPSGAAAGGQGT
ncbi:PilN domain-containing protein [Candidatus Binatia bacterium]|nr:PilN domain-containing protein [Candidatus Binatia bacterium]